MLNWRKRFIAAEAFEAAAFLDVDGDGVLDIVSGGYWYQGPEFRTRHVIADLVRRYSEYYDDGAVIPIDLTGDGRPDVVTGSWWNGMWWRENPGPDGGNWRVHRIADLEHVELVMAWDVDGDGELELVPNLVSGPLAIYKRTPGSDAWSATEVWEGPQGHGLGFGDVSGSGRGDFVVSTGWIESPAESDGAWVFYPDFDLGSDPTDPRGLPFPDSSAPILVVDVDGDGLNDIVVGHGHSYGLEWWRQGRDADGGRTWERRMIDPDVSQFHTVKWADIDGDGRPELVTGKRWRAHDAGDPGNDDDLGIWYYSWNGDTFDKHVIDAGPPGFGSGVGVQFDLADLSGNGYPDLVAPGKDGLWLFHNDGPS